MATKAKKIEIIQNGNPLLREISQEIPVSKIKSPEIKKIITDLKTAMDYQPDAVAISAVQIAKPVRLFIISGKIFSIINESLKDKPQKDLVFINPRILKVSKDKQLLEEGCLSVRYIYGKVTRPEKATVEAYDEEGNKFVRGFSGLLAQTVQHETDHLNGILFIDKAKNLTEMSPEDYEKALSEM